MLSDVLDPSHAVRPIAAVEAAPVYTSFAEGRSDAGLEPARGIAKAIMISIPIWLLVGLGVWAF